MVRGVIPNYITAILFALGVLNGPTPAPVDTTPAPTVEVTTTTTATTVLACDGNGSPCGTTPHDAMGFRDPTYHSCLVTDELTGLDRGMSPAPECLDPLTHTVPPEEMPTP